jgi:hypothetical protein
LGFGTWKSWEKSSKYIGWWWFSLSKKESCTPWGSDSFRKSLLKHWQYIMALWRDQAKPNEGNCGNCDGNLYGPCWMRKNRETSDQSWLIPSYSWEGSMRYYWTMGQNGLHCAKSFHSNDVCWYMCASADSFTAGYVCVSKVSFRTNQVNPMSFFMYSMFFFT